MPVIARRVSDGLAERSAARDIRMSVVSPRRDFLIFDLDPAGSRQLLAESAASCGTSTLSRVRGGDCGEVQSWKRPTDAVIIPLPGTSCIREVMGGVRTMWKSSAALAAVCGVPHTVTELLDSLQHGLDDFSAAHFPRSILWRGCGGRSPSAVPGGQKRVRRSGGCGWTC